VVTQTRNDQITIWEPATARVLATLSGVAHLRAVLGGPRLRLAVWEPGGRTVQCISALDGAVDATFEHAEQVSWAVAAPDGARILVAAGDKLLLWDVASRALVVPAVDFGRKPDFGTFDPSGHLAGLREQHESGVALFDVTTGAIAARGAIKSNGSIHHGWLDGTQWVVLARKLNGSALRNPVTDQLLFDAPIGAGTVTSDFAARRNRFALLGENGASQLWDADAAQPMTPRLWASGQPNRAQLSADGTMLLIASSEPAVRLWKMPATGGPAWSALEPVPTITTWWNAAGSEFHTLRADGRLTTRDASTGRLAIEPVALDDAAIAATSDGAGRLVFVGGAHGARLWDAENGKPAGPLIPCPVPIRDVALSADGSRAAVLMDERALLCNPLSGAVGHTLSHDGALRCVFGANGARLATITNEAVQLWDPETGRAIGQPIVPGGKWHEAAARFDTTGRRLVVWWGGPLKRPTNVRIVAAETGRDLVPPLEHSSAVSDVVFSPPGDLLISASRDQRLWLWRTSDGRLTRAPTVHADGIDAVGFSPDGLLFWSRTDRLLHTWETATGDAAAPVLHHVGPRPAEPGRKASGAVITHDKEEFHVAWSADSRISTCDGRGGVNVWDFRPGARPLEQMDTLSRVLSMHRLNADGALTPLTREELREAWEQWRKNASARGE
jgi:WD40 repeat protein